MSIKCCDLLLLKEENVSAVALDSLVECENKVTVQSATEAVGSLFLLNTIDLTPCLTADFKPRQQQEKYIPSLSFKYKIFLYWRDKPNCSSFGYNGNYVTLIQSDEINFGYISFISWIQIVKILTFEVPKAALEKNSVFLPANGQIQAEVCEIVREASLDWGLGVIFIRVSADSCWQRTNSSLDRQIRDTSDLEDSCLVQEIPIGKLFEQQGAIFGNAHYDLGNAITATCISRPEDTELARNDLYINLTSSGSKGEVLNYGCYDPNPLGFGWEILTTLLSFGFTHPDNFLVNHGKNVWMMTDISPAKVNNAVKSRTDNKGISADQTGVFRNAMCYIVVSSDICKALLFDSNLMECETNYSAEARFGYFLTLQFLTMFISCKHPWKVFGDYPATTDLSVC